MGHETDNWNPEEARREDRQRNQAGYHCPAIAACSDERAASEKLEIIRLIEGSHLSARLTLAKLGIPSTTFYRWYDQYMRRGEVELKDNSLKPKHVWNRIPDAVRRKVVKLAFKETELSPRELAVTFTDRESYFVSEASVYRVLKVHDLITSPAFIVIKAGPLSSL